MGAATGELHVGLADDWFYWRLGFSCEEEEEEGGGGAMRRCNTPISKSLIVYLIIHDKSPLSRAI